MMKIVIADDEYHIRTGIAEFVPWKELGAEVLEAQDGTSALAVYEEAAPEILLLDINMPGMSGLEVARTIREHDPDVQIIFLTGYDDFDKAKAAISVQASDYLLKPVSYGELVEALRKAMDRIEEAKSKAEYVHRLERKLHAFTPAAAERILLDWLHNRRIPREADSLLEELGMSSRQHSNFSVACVEIDGFYRYMDQVSQRDRQLYLYAYKKLAQEVFEAFGSYSIVLQANPSRLIAIAAASGLEDKAYAAERMKSQAERLQNAYRDYLKMSVTIGVSRNADQAADLPEAYREAIQAVERRVAGSGGGSGGQPDRNRPVMKAMEKAKGWIRDHLAEDITLPKIAAFLHMSPNYVSTLFKQATGETLTEYVTRVRFEKSKELFARPELKMHEIAARVGFADANYFSIAFKKYHGMPPSEYRQRYY
ncbi:response regulator [Paenibacillus thermotolerans]|uniref:response regulator n=1 Tax=Paenibacillus thermotolerans TaxID=3027807 RepID=UPI002368076C|nr:MULTISPECIES: response regulator [unclassified Paenibacillus]